ncbi:MAG: hypothetical protein KAR31_10080 [Candidatus Omnitrophica bacterium]|nr:hypothetical protein [Candidatus Omnitrophota bacterium]
MMMFLLMGCAAVIFVIAAVLLMGKPDNAQQAGNKAVPGGKKSFEDQIQVKINAFQKRRPIKELKGQPGSYLAVDDLTRGVRKVVIIILLAAIGVFVYSQRHGKPAVRAVESAVRDYLVGEDGKECSVRATVKRLKITRIGDFNRELKGWPVYSDFKVTCREPGFTSSWVSGDKPDKGMTCVAQRIKSGKLVCGAP